MQIPQQVTKLVKQWLSPKPHVVNRSSATYIRQQGWQLTGIGPGARWDGFYRTRYQSFRGKVECSTPPKFFVKDPPEGLSRHRHHMCFTDTKSGGWWSVHFQKQPQDLDSGLMELERILYEAVLLSKKTS